ncbi:MAG: DUF2480 family protein [Bacteroidota bacterium]
MQDTEIVNKVARSSLISFDLETIFPEGERIVLDIAPQLYMGLLLREKDFREFIKVHDWNFYSGKNVAVICSADAIVPVWAYMLIAAQLEPYAAYFVFGNEDALEQALWQRAIAGINAGDYADAKIVIKGCSDKPVPVFAYTDICRVLRPVASSIMYGEPCSTVPVFKKQKQA